MRKIIVFTSGPFCGTDHNVVALVPSDYTDEQIYEEFYPWACDHWDQWTRDDDDSDIEDEGPDLWFEDYNGEDHDGYRCGGGSFEEDFAREDQLNEA